MVQNSISVVVPTSNSFLHKRGSLHVCLESITTGLTQEDEIVLVLDECTDQTNEFIDNRLGTSSHGTPHQVIEVTGHHGERSYLRNRGAEASTNSILVFVDEDIIVSPHLFQMVREGAVNHQFGCGALRYSIPISMNSRELQRMVSTGRYIELIAWSVLPRNVNPLTGFRTLEEYSYLGSFGFVHRAVFEDVGGFDEAFAGWGFEDLNLMLRLSLTGDKWKFLGRSGKPLFHIAHKRPVGWELDKQRNRDLYLQREKDLGVTLRVNHIFKVYEGDGRSVLQTREDRQKDVELPHFW